MNTQTYFASTLVTKKKIYNIDTLEAGERGGRVEAGSEGWNKEGVGPVVMVVVAVE
jgi:hypothetical protein